MIKLRWLVTMVVGLVLLVALVSSTSQSTSAAFNNEAFEAERPSGRYDGTFSLTYRGRGWDLNWDKCDGDDYVFRINVNRSYAGNDWKLYSNNSSYSRTPTGRVPYGHDLNNANAHLCLGFKEFSGWFTRNPWSVSGVQQNVYTWRR